MKIMSFIAWLRALIAKTVVLAFRLSKCSLHWKCSLIPFYLQVHPGQHETATLFLFCLVFLSFGKERKKMEGKWGIIWQQETSNLVAGSLCCGIVTGFLLLHPPTFLGDSTVCGTAIAL